MARGRVNTVTRAGLELPHRFGPATHNSWTYSPGAAGFRAVEVGETMIGYFCEAGRAARTHG